jgi:D-arabinose 1-dehydrogenase-like Zn-dependent alcohol dehydrogenase
LFEERIGRIRGSYKGRQFEETAKPLHLVKLHDSLGWYECPIIELQKPIGKLCILGVTNNNLSFPSLSISDRSSKIISGSYLGRRSDMKKLIHFFAKNEIKPIVEIFPFNAINDVIARIKSNHIRFSAVLSTNIA